MKKTKIALLALATLGQSVVIAAESVESRIKNLEEEIALLKDEKPANSNGSIMNQLSSWASKTSIGGYGELHWNIPEEGASEVDFHRFVVYINHQFSDRIRLVTELELEHSLAGDGKPGEVELEQAYIEMDLTHDLQARAGLFLVPVGILNETHEPPTFYGVERNNVEKYIIPSTWWEAGLGFTKKFDSGLTLDAAITSGLQIDPAEGYIRGGRQKVAEANAENIVLTTRASYTGILGLKLSAFAQYNTDILAGSAADTSGATLAGMTFEYQNNGFGLRALYAVWDIDGVAAEAEDQSGFYIEPSYKFDVFGKMQAGVFARYEDLEYYKSGEKEYSATTVGVNFWPHENVVLKADYQIIDEGGTEDTSQVNLGLGFQF